ncbi:MAG: HD-GYP domain-containing protein [Bryobacteraceae bacterium]
MRFVTRTFLWSFLPFAALLTASFWTAQHLAVSSVREELRSSLRLTQRSMARMPSQGEMQDLRFLRILGDNAPLKAGLELMQSDNGSADARRTVEDQLREICGALHFDFLFVSGPDRKPIAGVIRTGERLAAMELASVRPPQRGFYTLGTATYQVASVPLNQDDENVGFLSVGELFDIDELGTPAVLARNGVVLKTSVPDVAEADIQAALSRCGPREECELRAGSHTYLSLPAGSAYLGNGYVLRSVQNVDAASGPVQSILRKVFLIAGVGALLAALVLSMMSSRSIVRPIAAVVVKLRDSARTAILPEFQANLTEIQEIRELMESFNRAAAVVHQGEENLRLAYVEFVQSLASALDARDPYTSGHSQRVSQGSCAIASALQFSATRMEEIRIAALLHDIGKIGIADSVLQKPGKLTAEEFRLIQQHPSIGRRILEGVHGFQTYLPVVELHHENWDGTGYPHGLQGEAVPLCARIVHVADAYDAMTSDRPYRRGMSHAQAVAVLEKFAGSQFDAEIVRIYTGLLGPCRIQDAPSETPVPSLQILAEAVDSQTAPQYRLGGAA